MGEINARPFDSDGSDKVRLQIARGRNGAGSGVVSSYDVMAAVRRRLTATTAADEVEPGAIGRGREAGGLSDGRSSGGGDLGMLHAYTTTVI